MPGPPFGFVKLLASSGSHCTKWADEQHWPAEFESRFVSDLPSPLSPLNRPSGFWPCVKSCLVGGSDKYSATVVEGDPKAPFSKATTPRCRGGRYSFPGLLHFTLDAYLIMLSVKQGVIKYHFLSLWYNSTWDWTQVSRAISKHCNHYANVRFLYLL